MPHAWRGGATPGVQATALATVLALIVAAVIKQPSDGSAGTGRMVGAPSQSSLHTTVPAPDLFGSMLVAR